MRTRKIYSPYGHWWRGWIEAVNVVGKSLDLRIGTIKIGPGCEYTDLYGAWADEKEIEDNGCLLIRPDFHVAWRQTSIQPNADKLLLQRHEYDLEQMMKYSNNSL